MATFPGDMHIGWGFGLEPDLSGIEADDPTRADERVNAFYQDAPQEEISESFLNELAKRPGNFERLDEPHLTDPLLAVSELEQRVNDLEERLRSLTLVVNDLHLTAEAILMIADGLYKRTEILARNADIFFTDDLEEKE